MAGLPQLMLLRCGMPCSQLGGTVPKWGVDIIPSTGPLWF